jgi:hypothetical protein
MRELTIQVVNCLANRVCHLTCCVLDTSYNLISNAFIRQLIVTGYSANALLHLSGETAGCATQALLGAPKRGVVREVLHIIVTGRVLRPGLIEHQVNCESHSGTREDPCKRFHKLSFVLDATADSRGIISWTFAAAFRLIMVVRRDMHPFYGVHVAWKNTWV